MAELTKIEIRIDEEIVKLDTSIKLLTEQKTKLEAAKADMTDGTLSVASLENLDSLIRS